MWRMTFRVPCVGDLSLSASPCGYWGLFGLTTGVGDFRPLVSKDGNHNICLNYGLLVQRYVRAFSQTEPLVALRYYYLLRSGGLRPFLCGLRLVLNTLSSNEWISRHLRAPGEVKQSLFLHCLTNLVIETREFEKLFGSRDAHGNKTVAAIETFESDEKARNRIIGAVAAVGPLRSVTPRKGP